MLHLSEAPDVLSSNECKRLCNGFSDFFRDKINSLKATINLQFGNSSADVLYADPRHTGESFSLIQPPTVEEVTKLISAMPAKSSPVDNIPTSLIKSCVDLFAPLITRLATLSFRDGVFPEVYKIASVTPLLKKKGLDRDSPANFRPISNLHTISKILERIFLSKIIDHIEQSPNFNRAQSAYRRGFSTETALLRLLNDVYSAADGGHRSLLVLLDLSAAFDCIDINTLERRLEHTFGFTGAVLSWLRSYLNNRSQFVRVGEVKSSTSPCKFGVPQGSVLGPLFFSLYVAPIANVIAGF